MNCHRYRAATGGDHRTCRRIVLRTVTLRRVAVDRKNYLFVGDVDTGKSIAGLYTLVSTCEARGINPFAYLADVIPRVQDHGPWALAQATA